MGRIGTHFYQIIFPVQLRHHEKMGISTREVNTAKVRNGLRKKRNSFQARRVRSFSIIIHILTDKQLPFRILSKFILYILNKQLLVVGCAAGVAKMPQRS